MKRTVISSRQEAYCLLADARPTNLVAGVEGGSLGDDEPGPRNKSTQRESERRARQGRMNDLPRLNHATPLSSARHSREQRNSMEYMMRASHARPARRHVLGLLGRPRLRLCHLSLYACRAQWPARWLSTCPTRSLARPPPPPRGPRASPMGVTGPRWLPASRRLFFLTDQQCSTHLSVAGSR